ncbi:hypothetical protein [Pseudoalteromonas shioyasakiensis]|uniref:hypothetical protein n=1 Tax=Pseudoalteromonas shioyasakiensis TaxID=1190813 RepID=UPI00078552FC|nr:hypothetical protein [Pseudoalteromonas shioyasakiensis]|tara:strand:- start:351 stop:812 length:462 start_codon:yes stop_codon:yes gene_type:complete
MYGSVFRVRYGAYIEKLAIEKGLNPREAENEVRELKGYPRIGERWIAETMLFQYIDALFADYEVLREASPDWLGQQRFDIYIPELVLAVEYQGQQHYKPVKLFGGVEGLKKTQQRDRDKVAKCKANNVSLVLFSYTDRLSEKLVMTRLKAFSK